MNHVLSSSKIDDLSQHMRGKEEEANLFVYVNAIALIHLSMMKLLGLGWASSGAYNLPLALLALPAVLVQSEGWIPAHEVTFVAEMNADLSASCSPSSSSKLTASCSSNGVIELLTTTDPSIACMPTSSSEMECSIACDGSSNSSCEQVFLNDNVGAVVFKCAAPHDVELSASIAFSEEQPGSCTADLFRGSRAQKSAQLGVICGVDETTRTPYFGHELFECGRQNEAIYLPQQDRYSCVETIDCGSSACDLTFLDITVAANVNINNLAADCYSNSTISPDSLAVVTVDNEVEESYLYTATYIASWSLFKLSTTVCQDAPVSTVTLSCLSSGFINTVAVADSIVCNHISPSELQCSGDLSLFDEAVTYTCGGDATDQALTSILYDEETYSCNSTAYHSVRMAAFCDSTYSQEDFFWECTQGDLAVDPNGVLTCFETLPCSSRDGCASSIYAVIMTASPNVQTCMEVADMTESPSATPSAAPSLGPSAMPSDQPSAVPSNMPSAVPSDMPSMVPSMVPSAAPQITDFPSLNPVQWVESITNLPTGHALDDDSVNLDDEDNDLPRVSEGIIASEERPQSEEDEARRRAMITAVSVVGGVALLLGLALRNNRRYNATSLPH